MKVLVASPVKRSMLYKESVDSVLALNWPDGIQVDVVFLVDGDKKSRWENQCRKLNQARRMALDGGYDALTTVDSDIIVPEDALQRLSAVGADVVYGLIVQRIPPYHWNATVKMRPTGEAVFLTEDKEAARAGWGKVIECEGHGQAISFVRRSVLEVISYQVPCPEKWAADWYFSFDCQRLGIKQVIDLGVVCGHIIQTPPIMAGNPNFKGILWPDPNEEKLHRMEPL